MLRDLTVALELNKPVSKRGGKGGAKLSGAEKRAKAQADKEAPVKKIWINPITGHIVVKVSYLVGNWAGE